MMKVRWLAVFLAGATLTLGCKLDADPESETDETEVEDPKTPEFFTGPIAPLCTEELAWCAQAKASASLSCLDVDLEPYSISMALEGKTDNVSCSADAGSTDLAFEIGAPQSSADYGVHEVRFWLPSYAGPGTYQLVTDTEAGDFRNMGLYVQGKAGGSQADEQVSWATAGWCRPLPCQAIVHEESEPIPTSDEVEEFRVRVEIQCEAGEYFWSNEGGDCGDPSNHCSLAAGSVFKFDVQCAQ